jgi:hypothetical protein
MVPPHSTRLRLAPGWPTTSTGLPGGPKREQGTTAVVTKLGAFEVEGCRFFVKFKHISVPSRRLRWMTHAHSINKQVFERHPVGHSADDRSESQVVWEDRMDPAKCTSTTSRWRRLVRVSQDYRRCLRSSEL